MKCITVLLIIISSVVKTHYDYQKILIHLITRFIELFEACVTYNIYFPEQIFIKK